MKRSPATRSAPGVDPDLEERLGAYLDGELSTTEVAAVNARLAADPVASAYLHDLEEISNGLGCDEVDRRAAESIRAQIRSKLRQPAPTRNPSLRRWAWPSLAVATVLVVLVTFGASSRWLPRRGSGSMAGVPVSIEAVSQQYTLALDALSRPTP